MNFTPLQIQLQKKGWRLIHLEQELIKRKTPVSYLTLLRIKHRYKTYKGKKLPYKPNRHTLADVARALKVSPSKIY